MNFSVVRNEHRGTYEVHLQGCRHLSLPKFTDPFTEVGDSGIEVGRKVERENEGIFTLLGPCVSTGKERSDWNNSHDKKVSDYLGRV